MAGEWSRPGWIEKRDELYGTTYLRYEFEDPPGPPSWLRSARWIWARIVEPALSKIRARVR